jgi:beta-alanine degradation protein BauB
MKMFLLGALFASSIFFAVHSQQSTQTQRIPLFENDDAKVWKSVITPDAPLAMHRHEHPRVIVAMTGGTMRIGSARKVYRQIDVYKADLTAT